MKGGSIVVSYMLEALKEAEKAYSKGEVPVGAVVVKDGEIIGRGHNLRETLKSPLAHAEIIAIKEAAETVGDWRLTHCSIYVTLEPCPMCTGALLQSRIEEINIGTFDPTAGACGTIIDLAQNPLLNSKVRVNWLYDEKCRDILKKFFNERRKRDS